MIMNRPSDDSDQIRKTYEEMLNQLAKSQQSLANAMNLAYHIKRLGGEK